ncbi:MAG: serine proteinase inhibitor, partial [Synergistaceae bacterium]|nr:serine proteinase inhibitor [Synergistaceae bacterium]
AAVTSVGMRMTSIPAVEREITFDRPFLYGIMDLEAGIPLFVGILENPAAH